MLTESCRPQRSPQLRREQTAFGFAPVADPEKAGNLSARRKSPSALSKPWAKRWSLALNSPRTTRRTRSRRRLGNASHIMVAAAPDYMRSIAVAEQSQQERVATLLLDADRSKQRARYQSSRETPRRRGCFQRSTPKWPRFDPTRSSATYYGSRTGELFGGRTMRCALSWQRLRLRTMPCVLIGDRARAE